MIDVSFVDTGGHGYAAVRAAGDRLETEFVCIPRPVERSERAAGGPLAYRVRYDARRPDQQGPGESLRLRRRGASSLVLLHVVIYR